MADYLFLSQGNYNQLISKRGHYLNQINLKNKVIGVENSLFSRKKFKNFRKTVNDGVYCTMVTNSGTGLIGAELVRAGLVLIKIMKFQFHFFENIDLI